MDKVSAVLYVFSKGGKYLVERRGHGEFNGLTMVPGGKIETGEEPEEALRREVREEVGAGVYYTARYIGVTDGLPGFRVWVYLLRLLHGVVPPCVLDSKGADLFAWLTPAEIEADLSMDDSTRNILRQAQDMERVFNAPEP